MRVLGVALVWIALGAMLVAEAGAANSPTFCTTMRTFCGLKQRAYALSSSRRSRRWCAPSPYTCPKPEIALTMPRVPSERAIWVP